jgi:hypothetical protein
MQLDNGSEADNSLEWCKMLWMKSLMALGNLCDVWGSGTHWLRVLLAVLPEWPFEGTNVLYTEKWCPLEYDAM